MLAISGSVEAARAGAAGQGFANVSGDIRALARESADNADKVKDVVYAVQRRIAAVRRELEIIVAGNEAEVEKGLAMHQRLNEVEVGMASVRQAAEDILTSAERTFDTTQEIQSATGQIAAAAEEAAGAAGQAAVAARQQARGAEDLAAAIEEIAELAEALQAPAE
jgi:methyl-accepting chemotaxis protein